MWAYRAIQEFLLLLPVLCLSFTLYAFHGFPDQKHHHHVKLVHK
jgi:hypothetical protein